jgi:hypothetical protein
MLVVRVHEPLRQLAGVMVEDVRQRCDAVPGYVVIDVGPVQAEAREIANSLRSVVVALAVHERGQVGREFVGHADRYPLHGAASGSERRMRFSKD